MASKMYSLASGEVAVKLRFRECLPTEPDRIEPGSFGRLLYRGTDLIDWGLVDLTVLADPATTGSLECMFVGFREILLLCAFTRA